MYRKLLLILFLFLYSLVSFSQKEEDIVFKINGKPVCISEVRSAYERGNKYADTKESVSDFLQSYIKLKLNVEEALAQHLDTAYAYVNAYESYRSQVAAPYMVDTVYEVQYIKDLYQRSLENIEINHIVFPFEKDVVFPADTLSVYKEALAAREIILKKGFGTDAFHPKNAGSKIFLGAEKYNGYAGWIAPFMLSYKVENAVYSLPLNAVSFPIRSAKGYHIVQVLKKRPAVGSVEVEQVVFNFPHIPPLKHHIDSVGTVARREYSNIKSGKNTFQDLCDEFTRVFQTSKKGCYLGIIGIDANLPMSFIGAAFNLDKAGDISEPIMSDYGFHIIRLLRKYPMGSYDQMRYALKDRVIKSDKVQDLSDDRRKKLLDKFKVNINQPVYASLNNIAATISPRDSLFFSSVTNGDDILVDIDGKKKYQVKAFVKYLEIRRKEVNVDPTELQILQITEASPYSLSTDILKEYFDSFLFLVLSDYAEVTLGEREPEFYNTMKVFSEELLSYEVKNKNVWKRSASDEAGLSDYFIQHRNKYSLSQKKYKGLVLHVQNDSMLEKVKNFVGRKKVNSKLIEDIRTRFNTDSVQVKIEIGSWIKGDNRYVDNMVYGESEPIPYKGYPKFLVIGRFIDKPEDYTDVRSEVEVDYQEELEKNWDKYLEGKYKVEIDESVLNRIG